MFRLGCVPLALLVVTANLWCSAVTAAAAVPAPDLSGYTEVGVAPTLDSTQNRHTYFKTPGGLYCGFAPSPAGQIAGCDGAGGIPGGPPGANEIVMAADPALRGWRHTAARVFTGDASTPVVREGQKVRDGDVECAVTGSQSIACTKGSPAEQWMVASPPAGIETGSGIGPATAGLPDGFPDPIDYIADDGGYTQAAGIKNTFRTFTVDNGLTCQIEIFSGGDVGCDGTLPGVQQGENEVLFSYGGDSRVRHVATPNFSPTGVGPIQRMPVGHRVHGIGTTCMATDGGVACIGGPTGTQSGFQVTPTGVITY